MIPDSKMTFYLPFNAASGPYTLYYLIRNLVYNNACVLSIQTCSLQRVQLSVDEDRNSSWGLVVGSHIDT